jgi:hypothetical protein
MEPDEWEAYWASLTEEERAEERRMMADYANDTDARG